MNNTAITPTYLQRRDITIIRGDTFGLFSRLNSNGSPVMLGENSIVSFMVFGRAREPVIAKRYAASAQDESGYVEVVLLPAETAALQKAERYTYELEWLINSDTIYTPLYGDLTVMEDGITADNRGA